MPIILLANFSEWQLTINLENGDLFFSNIDWLSLYLSIDRIPSDSGKSGG